MKSRETSSGRPICRESTVSTECTRKTITTPISRLTKNQAYSWKEDIKRFLSVYLKPHSSIGSLRTVVRRPGATYCGGKLLLILEDFVSGAAGKFHWIFAYNSLPATAKSSREPAKSQQKRKPFSRAFTSSSPYFKPTSTILTALKTIEKLHATIGVQEHSH